MPKMASHFTEAKQINHESNNNISETLITKPEKPKLFKPYKSEE